MDGVGSFSQPSRTLYCGGLQCDKYVELNGKGMVKPCLKGVKDALWKHFSEWGELEAINIVPRISAAFPRYRLRTSAEFAREAMYQQALDKKEVLLIRWAREDPNPMAKEAIERADRDALVAIMKAKGINMDDQPFAYPSDYKPSLKRARDGDEGTNDVAYPDTDSQYVGNAEAAACVGDAANCLSKDPSGEDVDGFHAGGGGGDDGGQEDDETVATLIDDEIEIETENENGARAPEGEGWTEHEDPESGAIFFYNEKTGESSWGQAPVQEKAVDGS